MATDMMTSEQPAEDKQTAHAPSGDIVAINARSSRAIAPTIAPMPPAAVAAPLQTPAPITPTPPRVSFDRRELNTLLNLYGRRVAEGEWRDYAIDFHKDRAIFSVFRRTSEAPLYRIEKQPRLERKQGAWSVVSAAGLILKRGNDLSRVLAVIDRPLRLIRG